MFQIKVVLHHLTMKEKSSKYLDIVLIIFALKPWMTILTLQKGLAIWPKPPPRTLVPAQP